MGTAVNLIRKNGSVTQESLGNPDLQHLLQVDAEIIL